MMNSALASLLVGNSQEMQQLRASVLRVGPSRLPVFVTGPTGAGKELVAHALHVASARKGAFVAFNVCAVSETMFEDALFGHSRGAFTGAVNESAGYLAEADKGTVFLDEIGGLPLNAQAKLLRAIETQTYRAVGASRDRTSDFRVLTASNEDLQQLCDEGKFRPDLRHRLAGVAIRVPSLAERRDDIPLLVETFLRESSQTPGTRIEPAALERLKQAPWPGNVRQLKHTVDLLLTFFNGEAITEDDVRASLDYGHMQPNVERMYEEKDRQLMMVMEQVGWDVTAAAKQLGVHRATVYRRLKRLPQDRMRKRSHR